VALLLTAGAAQSARADVVDRVVLRVNDRIATLLDYDQRRADTVAQIAASDLPPERREEVLANLGSRLFRDMLEELLLVSRADQLRIQPTEEEVDRGVRGVRENLGIGSDDELASALASQGMSLAEFREQVRTQLRMRAVVSREVTAEIDLEEDDLRRVYRADEARFRLPERFRVRELIVLEDEERDPAEVRALADAIHRELEQGRPFEELASLHAESGDTSDLVDLGWIEKGELDAELEAAIASLGPGEYSQPVPARGGLHILEVLEHEPSRLQTFGEVADQIEKQERQRLYNEKIGTYMRKLEESAYVRAEPPPDATGFRTVAGSRVEEDPFSGFEPVGGEPEVEPPTDRPEPEGVEPPPAG
jgi:peptidyl-prolyl cis-trans isomerase SurA